jgi:hypothetical protein
VILKKIGTSDPIGTNQEARQKTYEAEQLPSVKAGREGATSKYIEIMHVLLRFD